MSFVKGKDVCCNDTFGFAAQEVTKLGFKLVVWRNDSQSGWGQKFSAEWGAVADIDTSAQPNPEEDEDESGGRTEL